MDVREVLLAEGAYLLRDDGRRKGKEITSRTSRISLVWGFGLCTVDTEGSALPSTPLML